MTTSQEAAAIYRAIAREIHEVGERLSKAKVDSVVVNAFGSLARRIDGLAITCTCGWGGTHDPYNLHCDRNYPTDM